MAQQLMARRIPVTTSCPTCGKARTVARKLKELRNCLSCACKARGNNGNGYKKGHPQYNTGRTRFKRGNIPANWKGDAVGYTALHDWVRRNLGTPQGCDDCGTTEKRIYQWSNMSGEYKRDLSDWKRRCIPCHKSYDLNRIRGGGKRYEQLFNR